MNYQTKGISNRQKATQRWVRPIKNSGLLLSDQGKLWKISRSLSRPGVISTLACSHALGFHYEQRRLTSRCSLCCSTTWPNRGSWEVAWPRLNRLPAAWNCCTTHPCYGPHWTFKISVPGCQHGHSHTQRGNSSCEAGNGPVPSKFAEFALWEASFGEGDWKMSPVRVRPFIYQEIMPHPPAAQYTRKFPFIL